MDTTIAASSDAFRDFEHQGWESVTREYDGGLDFSVAMLAEARRQNPTLEFRVLAWALKG